MKRLIRHKERPARGGPDALKRQMLVVGVEVERVNYISISKNLVTSVYTSFND